MVLELEHTFKTPYSPDRLNAILTKLCRAPFKAVVEGHDPTVLPTYRIICVTFATIEDRDRLRIALRQLEKEDMAAARAPQRGTPEQHTVPPRQHSAHA